MFNDFVAAPRTGADSAEATGNFAPVLIDEPGGANIKFGPGTFQGLVSLSEVKVQ